MYIISNWVFYWVFSFLIDLASGNEFWISGSDASTEGQWLWYGSIQSWGYTKWNTGKIKVSLMYSKICRFDTRVIRFSLY